jgi:hypothetical protein
VLTAKALVHVGSTLAAGAAGALPSCVQLAAFFDLCKEKVASMCSNLQDIALPGDWQVQQPGHARKPAAAAADAAVWCVVTAPPNDGTHGPVLQRLVKKCDQLAKLCDKAAAVSTAELGQQEAAVLQQLEQKMQQFGAAVCAALPVRFCCNSVQCMSLAGFSEQQQVTVSNRTCSGCKFAR